MSVTVKVKDQEFVKSAGNAPAGSNVEFINKRGEPVTVTLLGGKWSQSSVALQPDGQSGDKQTVQILSTATGSAKFQAPVQTVGGKARDKDTIIGDIDIDPSK